MDNRKFQSASSASPPAVEASPSNGYPTDGNPSTATPATIPGARWFHQIGEELRNVIASAGLTPSDSDLTQLQQAIAAMIASGVANDFKASVRIATTANIASLTGLAAIDGKTPIAGDRILVKDQSTGSQNGIYVAAAGAWSRATDADTGTELNGGALISVEEGTTNAETIWALTNDGTVTIGSTALVFQWAAGLNGVTAAQFDNSRKLATTAFVAANSGRDVGLGNISGVTTLTAASHAGKFLRLTGTTYAVTLPLANTFPAGVKIMLVSEASGAVTVQRQGTDNIVNPAGGQVTSKTMALGDTITLESDGISLWFVSGGSLALPDSSGMFGFSNATPGYQKLPSGLIIQWGQTGTISTGSFVDVTLPISFVTQGYSHQATGVSGVVATSPLTMQFNSVSSIRITNNGSPIAANWLVVGK